MDINYYTQQTRSTAIYPQDRAIEYLFLGLSSEVGEVAGKYKKYVRGDYSNYQDVKDDLSAELGDVFWYLCRLCDELNLEVNEVLNSNLDKLSRRQLLGTLQGDGDAR